MAKVKDWRGEPGGLVYVPDFLHRAVIDHWKQQGNEQRAQEAAAAYQARLAQQQQQYRNLYAQGGAYNMQLSDEPAPVEYPGPLLRREDLKVPWIVPVSGWLMGLLALGSALAWVVLL